MSRKGLSLDEKKTKMMEIFHETKDFYQLKELEKIAPKTKGIVQQSVKDVLDDLKGDGLVDFDKIGTSNYFWSFPSAAGAIKQNKLDKQTLELKSMEQKCSDLEQGYSTNLVGREETAERTALLKQLEDQKTLTISLKKELEAYGASDPVKLENKKRGIALAKQASVLWTENALILFKILRDQGPSEEEITNVLELGSGWDEVPPFT